MDQIVSALQARWRHFKLARGQRALLRAYHRPPADGEGDGQSGEYQHHEKPVSGNSCQQSSPASTHALSPWSSLLRRGMSQRSANYPLLGPGKQAIPCCEFLAPHLAAKPLACCRSGEGPYGFGFLGILPSDLVDRKGVLQIQPELLGGPEILGQASRHFGGNSPLLPNNVVHGRRRDMQLHGQPVSGDTHWLQKLLQENFSRMHRPTRGTLHS